MSDEAKIGDGLVKDLIGLRQSLEKETPRPTESPGIADKSDLTQCLSVDASHEAVFVAQDGVLKFAGSKTADILRRNHLDIIGIPFEKFLHPEDRDTMLALHRARIDGEPGLKCFPMRVLAKNGEVRWVEAATVLIAWEGRPATLGFAKDITEDKLAQEKLAQSERLLSAAERLAHVGAVEWDMVSGELLFSEEWRRIHGTRTCPATLKEFLEITHPEDRGALERGIQASIETGASYVNRYRIIRPDSGEIRFVRWSGEIIRNEAGRPVKLIGSASDITEQALAEAALSASESRYRQLFEQAPIGIFQSTVEGAVLNVNPAYAEMFGYESPGDVLAGVKNVAADIYADPEKRVQIVATALEQNRLISVENLCRRKDGSFFTGNLHFQVIRNEDGSVQRLEGFVEDISKRKAAERALLENLEFLQTLLEAIPNPVFYKDRQGRYLGCNQAFEDFLGLPKSRIIGKTDSDLVPDRIVHERQRQDDELFDSLGVQIYEETVTRPDGSDRDVVYYRSTFADSSNCVAGLIGVVLDITDRKQAEEEKERFRTQLLHAQKMEAIGTLAGGIAHDFNNLLQVTLGYSELLLAGKQEADPDREDLLKIFQAAKNGAELVHRLLTFSRKVEPNPSSINLNRQIVQVEKFLLRTLPKMIDIELDLAADLAEINADPVQIEQVLMNLAVNSRDAMPDGGKLKLRTANVSLFGRHSGFHVEAHPGDYVLLSVSDTGAGMDRETVDHIFEPFFTTKEQGRGTGLGLAMVYGIIKQNMGYITCGSVPGAGTTFDVYFPAVEPDEKPEIEIGGVTPAFGTETILLVDDDEFVRDLGCRILSAAGYTVLTAANGLEALNLVKKKRNQISLVVLDMIMPTMGGYECLKRLLQMDGAMRVLVTSGYLADSSVRESLRMGARGFVGKPFSMNRLLQRVREALDEG
jgi:two-component system, cell cycle sensor histidine kinase and response regulator CckA